MGDLIRALIILSKYATPYECEYPFCCSHDELKVCIDPKLVSAEDVATLEELGFNVYGAGCFASIKYGSC